MLCLYYIFLYYILCYMCKLRLHKIFYIYPQCTRFFILPKEHSCFFKTWCWERIEKISGTDRVKK